MKVFCKIVVAVAVLTVAAAAQTSANSSASTGATVSPGHAGASVNSSQNVQAGGASASANSSSSAQVAQQSTHEHSAKSQSKKDNSRDNNVSTALASGATLQAVLTKPVDAKKAKPGDQVTAKLTQDVKTNGKVVLRKGSKLTGHVTEAQARGKGQSESKLGLVFDKAQLKGGEEASINAMIQALAPPVRSTAMADADEMGSMSTPAPMGGSGPKVGGGGLIGGVTGGATSTVGDATGPVGNVGGAVGGINSTVNSTAGAASGGLNAEGALTSGSRGVIGLQGLSLNSVSAAGAQASVISSATHNVKLESGTQMVLQVTSTAK